MKNQTFWTSNPTILFNKDYIIELWPNTHMSFDDKLNAITRLVILLTIIGCLVTFSMNFLYIGLITIIIIVLYYNTRQDKITTNSLNEKEGFSINNTSRHNSNNVVINNPETLKMHLKEEFETINKKNPFSNVLLTEINDAPDRKSAPPSFNPIVHDDITKNTKKTIQSLNTGIKSTNKQLFGDLGEEFEFDQSMRNFYSTPNTKVCNDQGAFADYLYGNMPSCKDGDSFACLKDNQRYNLY
jgi:hypothetical protein